MAINVISDEGTKFYTALSTDISGSKLTGIAYPGSELLITDTGRRFLVLAGGDLIPDLKSDDSLITRSVESLVIESGSSVTATALNIKNQVASSLLTPADWNTANISFQGATSDGIYRNLYEKDGTEYTITSASALSWFTLDFNDFFGVENIKIISGTRASASNQSGSRILEIIKTNA